MGNLIPTWSGNSQSNKHDDDNRLLKRLKIVLLFWLVSFILTIIWFSNSPAF